MKKSRAFYDSLGWEMAHPDMAEHICFYNLNGFVFALYPLDALCEEVGQESTPQGSTFTLAYNVYSKEEVDKILAHVGGLGADIHAAVERHWGGYSGYFQDPDGHFWEVAYNPFTLPKADGTYGM